VIEKGDLTSHPVGTDHSRKPVMAITSTQPLFGSKATIAMATAIFVLVIAACALPTTSFYVDSAQMAHALVIGP
jgi:hypothetical protein